MTDSYGNDPQHDHDHDMAHEAPSHEEFAAISEEHAGEDPMVAGNEVVKATGRSALPIAAAIGGALILGAVAWWQLGGAAKAPPAAVMPPPVASDASNKPTAAMAVPSLEVAPKTADTPASLAQSATVALPSTPPAADTQGASATVAMPGAASPTSSATIPAAPVMAAQNPVMPSGAAIAAAAPVAHDPALSGRVDDLAARLDAMQKSVDQISNMMAAGAPPSKETQDRLDKIEQQIAALHPTASRPAMPSLMPGAAPAATHSMMETARHGRAARQSRHLQAAGKTTAKPKIKAMKEASFDNKSHMLPDYDAPKWVLRGASPTQALVASSATSNDLRTVRIGDDLPGIGTVTAITEKDGQWSVQGTQGVVQ